MLIALMPFLRAALVNPAGAAIVVTDRESATLLGRWPLSRSSRIDDEGNVWLRILPPIETPPDSDALRDGIFAYAVRPHAFCAAELTGTGLRGLNADETELYEIVPATAEEREVIDDFERRVARMPLEAQQRVRTLLG